MMSPAAPFQAAITTTLAPQCFHIALENSQANFRPFPSAALPVVSVPCCHGIRVSPCLDLWGGVGIIPFLGCLFCPLHVLRGQSLYHFAHRPLIIFNVPAGTGCMSCSGKYIIYFCLLLVRYYHAGGPPAAIFDELFFLPSARVIIQPILNGL